MLAFETTKHNQDTTEIRICEQCQKVNLQSTKIRSVIFANIVKIEFNDLHNSFKAQT